MRIYTSCLKDVVASSGLEHLVVWLTADTFWSPELHEPTVEDTLWWIPSDCNSALRNFRMSHVGGRAPGCKKHCCINRQCSSKTGPRVGLCCVCPSATLIMINLQCLTSAQGSLPERTYNDKLLVLVLRIVTHWSHTLSARQPNEYTSLRMSGWIDVSESVKIRSSGAL
jgi:hypothetical protein